MKGKVERSRRAASVHTVDSLDLEVGETNLNPNLYDVKTFEYPDTVEYIPYPFDEEDEDDYDYDFYNVDDEDLDYDFSDIDTDSGDYEPYQTFKPTTNDKPIVSRTWLDNVINFRNGLFGDSKSYNVKRRKGKPQLKIHYPNFNSKPFVSLTKANRLPLSNVSTSVKDVKLIDSEKLLKEDKTSESSNGINTKEPDSKSTTKRPIKKNLRLKFDDLNNLTSTQVFTPEEIELYGIKLYEDMNSERNLLKKPKIKTFDSYYIVHKEYNERQEQHRQNIKKPHIKTFDSYVPQYKDLKRPEMFRGPNLLPRKHFKQKPLPPPPYTQPLPPSTHPPPPPPPTQPPSLHTQYNAYHKPQIQKELDLLPSNLHRLDLHNLSPRKREILPNRLPDKPSTPASYVSSSQFREDSDAFLNLIQ